MLRQLVSGGKPTQQLSPEGWYAIAPLIRLKADKIHSFNICGLSLLVVLEEKTPIVFDRACPHMGIDLAKGQLSGSGQILCPYHNEPFCTSTGDYKGSTFKTRMHLHRYQTCVNYGWLWFYNGSQPKYDLPIFTESEHDFTWQQITVSARMDNLMLNAIDGLHFVSLHRGLLSGKERFYQVEPINDYVFRCNMDIDMEARGVLNIEALDRIVYGPSLSINGVCLNGQVLDYRILTFRPKPNGKTEIVMINCIRKNRPNASKIEPNIPQYLKPFWKLLPGKLIAMVVNLTLFFQDLVVTRNIISDRRRPDVGTDQPAIYYLRLINRLQIQKSSKAS